MLDIVKIGTSGKLAAAAAVSAACVSGLVGGILWANTRSEKKDKIPEKWIRVGSVSKLTIYPVKSLGGVSVEEATAGKLGLKGSSPFLRDRTFVVVNSGANFLTQRQIPALALVQVDIVDDKIKLWVAGSEPLNEITVEIPKDTDPSLRKTCRVWYDKISSTLDCGDAVGNWLSTFTGTEGLRLYYSNTSDKTERRVEVQYKKFQGMDDDQLGAFQDVTSYMLMTEESISAVNNVLTVPLTHKTFRPSVLVKGVPEPFAEDFWGYIRIGDEGGVVFKTSVPCARCKLTTVDPATGTFSEDGEPVKTIRSLKRQVGDRHTTALVAKDAILGTHMGIFDGCNRKIKVGDPVFAALL